MKILKLLNKFVRFLIYALAAIAGFSVVAIAVLTMTDIICRMADHPITGVYDIVGILGSLAITCAIPLTKAVKGHIAIEFFYHRFNRRGKFAMDFISRVLMLVFFTVLTWQSVRYGNKFFVSGEVTPTLYLPIFWVLWVLALSSALTAYVTFYHLVLPGKSMMNMAGGNN